MFIAVAGDAINWFWSFRDYSIPSLSKSYYGDVEPPKSLLNKKLENRILWGFHSERDFNDLRDTIRREGEIKVVLVANAVSGVSKRGVIGFGRISEDMLVGFVYWDYWPIPPRAGKKWDWKFFIEIECAIPALLDNVDELRSLSKGEFRSRIPDPRSRLARFIGRCAPFIITLIPSNITQGSKFDIRDEEYYTLKELALSKWRPYESTIKSLSFLNVTSILKIIERYGLYYSDDVLAVCVAALKSGKHLLLMGAPGTGKSMLARVLAEALGFELETCTASSTWTRYDFIGGPVLGENGRLEWRCGHLLRALAKHYELKEKEKRGVILLVEELNRAEADKVLAEFFTMFPSSNPEDWIFPESLYEEMEAYKSGRKGAIDKYGEALLKYLDKYKRKIPEDFRVIATVNTFDRAFLFTLGYALQRRFVVVEILPPEDVEAEKRAVIKQLILRGLKRDDTVERVCDEAVKLVGVLRRVSGRLLGTGIAVDSAYLAYQMVKSGLTGNVREAVERAAIHVALPQLELLGETVDKIASELERKELNYTILAKAVRNLGSRRPI